MSEEQPIQQPPTDPPIPLPQPNPSEPATKNTETIDMEVHHHPHVHHKKKWTDYLFEFLMLFLAVSAGYFVENQREHYIEHNRSEQYAAFLYSDLVTDTVNLKERTEFMATSAKKLDTLIMVLESPIQNDSTIARIYGLSAYAYLGVFFSATTSTMEQLKSSGSLRYFRSSELISRFSQYDTDLQRLQSVEDRNAYLNEKTRILLAEFLDVKNISRFVRLNTAVSSEFTLMHPTLSRPLKLYTTDRAQFQQYANLCALKQLDWNTRIGLQTRLFYSASELLKALKKEYRLDK